MKNAYRRWIGGRLRDYRLKKQMSQNRMSETLRIKLCTYASYEEGRAEPSIYTLKRFCKICRTSIDKFLEGSPENEPAYY